MPSDNNRHGESRFSRIGLNAANFFQAEAVGVVLPVLNGYLKQSGWSHSSIGIATGMAGLCTLCGFSCWFRRPEKERSRRPPASRLPRKSILINAFAV